MKTTLMGRGKFMSLPEVLPRDLAFGQYYVCVAKMIDDYTGEEGYLNDMMTVEESSVTRPDGSGVKAKCLVFLKTQHKSLLSQLATPCKFFGPIGVDVDVTEEKPAAKSAISQEMKTDAWDQDISVTKDS